MAQTNRVFVGIQGAALALDRATGEQLWRTELKGSDFVTVVVSDGDLFAASRGRLYRLDPTSGDVMWINELRGLGYGIVSIAGEAQGGLPGAAEKHRRDAQARAAAVS
jgi:outer membrane protein assembly factor BamB